MGDGPPMGIIPLDAYFVLVIYAVYSIMFTVLLGTILLIIQYLEYNEASFTTILLCNDHHFAFEAAA